MVIIMVTVIIAVIINDDLFAYIVRYLLAINLVNLYNNSHSSSNNNSILTWSLHFSFVYFLLCRQQSVTHEREVSWIFYHILNGWIVFYGFTKDDSISQYMSTH